jgi:hypothetical protein
MSETNLIESETQAAPTVDITKRVADLAALRRARAVIALELAEKRAWFDAEYAPLLASAQLAGEAVVIAEQELRIAVVQQYLIDENKAPAAGVSVKVFDYIEYDRAQALAWAQEHKIALVPESLDAKAFEKIAKASAIAFVQVIPDPRVTIATDLDKALGLADQPA